MAKHHAIANGALRSIRAAAVAASLCAVALAAISLSGCGSSSNIAATPTPWPTEVVVQQTTYTVTRGTILDVFDLQGRASPVTWEPIFFKADGKLSVLNAVEGTSVKQGTVLAELDSKTLVDQLTQARLSLDQVQSQAQQQADTTKYALERARLNLQVQQLALQKMRRSADQGVSAAVAQAQADMEKARSNLQKAQAAYNAIAWRNDLAATQQAANLQQATIDSNLAETKYYQVLNDNDIAVAQQELQVKLAELAVQELEEKKGAGTQNDANKAQMQVDALERQIEERKLRAPYDGIVVAIGINLQGMTRGFAQRPKVGDNIQAYSALVVMAKPEPLEITVDASQKRVPELYVGQPVTLTHSAWTRPFTATITALPVAMSSTGNAVTSLQAVRIALPPNAPPMSNGDPLGITVEADRHSDIIFLPSIAIRQFAGRSFVVLQDGDKQRRVDVKAGLANGTHTEILEGLKEGDVVIAP